MASTEKIICIVATFDHEERFIDEWLVYHRRLGVRHFYFYNAKPKSVLKRCLKTHSSYCTIVSGGNCKSGNEEEKSKMLYQALKEYVQSYKWVIFLRVEEFICVARGNSIFNILTKNKDKQAISLNKYIYGHNGMFIDPKRLVTAVLTRRMLLSSPDCHLILNSSSLYSEDSQLNNKDFSNVYVIKNTSGAINKKASTIYINQYKCRSFCRWMHSGKNSLKDLNKLLTSNNRIKSIAIESRLKNFVCDIALNKNELIDEEMSKHKFIIQKDIAQLNKALPFRDELKLEKNLIDENLTFIYKNIIGSATTDEIGLLNGKAGMALFLFTYSRYVKKPSYAKEAIAMISDISNTISVNSTLSYKNGLAGFGALIEYLVAHGFIKADTNELLLELDKILYHQFIMNAPTSSTNKETAVGIGRYFYSRLSNPINNYWHQREKNNKQILFAIIEELVANAVLPIDFLQVLNFITRIYDYFDDDVKLRSYMRLLGNKITINTSDDSELFLRNFVLLNAAKTSKDNRFINLSKLSLERITLDIPMPYKDNHKDDVLYSIFYSKIYFKLYKHTKNIQLKRLAVAEYNAAVLQFKSVNVNETPDFLSQSVGNGLLLLSTMFSTGSDLFDLLTPDIL